MDTGAAGQPTSFRIHRIKTICLMLTPPARTASMFPEISVKE